MASAWIGFIAFVLLMLALDLGIFHRKAHVVTMKEAVAWSAVWVALGLAFAVLVYLAYEGKWLGLGGSINAVDGLANDGPTATEKYLTGYVVEKSLSVDNIFVITMFFTFFAVPPLYQHRVLYWGILGALVLRGLMIALGARLIAEFHWMLYVFAVFLIVTALKMLFLETDLGDPNSNIVVRFARRLFPVTSRFHGEHFIVRAGAPASYESALSRTPASFSGRQPPQAPRSLLSRSPADMPAGQQASATATLIKRRTLPNPECPTTCNYGRFSIQSSSGSASPKSLRSN